MDSDIRYRAPEASGDWTQSVALGRSLDHAPQLCRCPEPTAPAWIPVRPDSDPDGRPPLGTLGRGSAGARSTPTSARLPGGVRPPGLHELAQRMSPGWCWTTVTCTWSSSFRGNKRSGCAWQAARSPSTKANAPMPVAFRPRCAAGRRAAVGELPHPLGVGTVAAGPQAAADPHGSSRPARSADPQEALPGMRAWHLQLLVCCNQCVGSMPMTTEPSMTTESP